MGGGGQAGAAFPGGTGAGTPTAQYITRAAAIEGGITAQTAGASIYDGAVAIDPELQMGPMSIQTQSRATDFNTAVDAFAPNTDYGTYVQLAIDEADADATFPAVNVAAAITTAHTSERGNIKIGLDAALSAAAQTSAGTAIGGLVDAFERRMRKQYVKATGRLAAGMSTIGAVNSSAFTFAMGSIENQMLAEVADYTAKTSNEYVLQYLDVFKTTFQLYMNRDHATNQSRRDSRDRMVAQGSQELATLWRDNISADNMALGIQAHINQQRYIGKDKQMKDDLWLDSMDANYDLEFSKYLGNFLASAGGAANTGPTHTPTESVLGNIASAAGTGNMIAPGGLGAGIGAGVGAIASLF